jgi:hypothetical protein
MNVVIVKWVITRGAEETFLTKWRSLSFKDSSGLFREFLSPVGRSPLSTWDLGSDASSVFINVGIWESAEAFERQVGKFMAEKHPFEVEPRQRIVLDPVVFDRAGKFVLPEPAIFNPDVRA